MTNGAVAETSYRVFNRRARRKYRTYHRSYLIVHRCPVNICISCVANNHDDIAVCRNCALMLIDIQSTPADTAPLDSAHADWIETIDTQLAIKATEQAPDEPAYSRVKDYRLCERNNCEYVRYNSKTPGCMYHTRFCAWCGSATGNVQYVHVKKYHYAFSNGLHESCRTCYVSAST